MQDLTGYVGIRQYGKKVQGLVGYGTIQSNTKPGGEWADFPGMIRLDDGRLFFNDEFTTQVLSLPFYATKAARKGIVLSAGRLARQGSTSREYGGVEITGLMPDDRIPNAENVLQRMREHQKRAMQSVQRRYAQRIALPGGAPIALAFLSDWHLGNAYTDYEQIDADCATICATPGMYAFGLGDYIDNWITPKLSHIQRYQPMSHDEEISLLRHFFKKYVQSEKLLAMVAGNHDNRTKDMSGVDLLREILDGVTMLYDPDEILVTLAVGDAEWRLKARHKWRYRSILNPFHSFMRDLEKTDDWDFAFGGHVHSGSHYATWDHYDREEDAPKKRTAVMVGTYEYHSKFGVQCGFPRHVGSGSVTVIYQPDGGYAIFNSVQESARYLTYLRGGK